MRTSENRMLQAGGAGGGYTNVGGAPKPTPKPKPAAVKPAPPSKPASSAYKPAKYTAPPAVAKRPAAAKTPAAKPAATPKTPAAKPKPAGSKPAGGLYGQYGLTAGQGKQIDTALNSQLAQQNGPVQNAMQQGDQTTAGQKTSLQGANQFYENQLQDIEHRGVQSTADILDMIAQKAAADHAATQQSMQFLQQALGAGQSSGDLQHNLSAVTGAADTASNAQNVGAANASQFMGQAHQQQLQSEQAAGAQLLTQQLGQLEMKRQQADQGYQAQIAANAAGLPAARLNLLNSMYGSPYQRAQFDLQQQVAQANLGVKQTGLGIQQQNANTAAENAANTAAYHKASLGLSAQKAQASLNERQRKALQQWEDSHLYKTKTDKFGHPVGKEVKQGADANWGDILQGLVAAKYPLSTALAVANQYGYFPSGNTPGYAPYVTAQQLGQMGTGSARPGIALYYDTLRGAGIPRPQAVKITQNMFGAGSATALQGMS